MFKVHPIDAGDQRQRRKNGSNDGKHLHHIIGLMGVERQIAIAHIRRHLAIRGNHLGYLQQVIVDIRKITPSFADALEMLGIQHPIKQIPHRIDGLHQTQQKMPRFHQFWYECGSRFVQIILFKLSQPVFDVVD